MKSLNFKAITANPLGIVHIEAATSLTKGGPGRLPEGFLHYRTRF